MQLIKSLFCFKGADNNERFIVLSFLTLALFVLFNIAILDTVAAKLILILLLGVISFASSIRRCRDANKTSKLAWLATSIFSVALLIVAFIPFTTSYIALIFPVMTMLVLFSYPTATAKIYVFGYNGPVDLSELSQPVTVDKHLSSNRIEPSLFGQTITESEYESRDAQQYSEYAEAGETEENTNTASAQPAKNNELALFISTWLTKNNKAMIIATSILVLLSIVVIAWPFIDNAVSESQIEDELIVTAKVNAVVARNDMLKMPDGFYLLLDTNKGLIIHWKADQIADGELWSQASAQGDDSCSNIEFNNGDKVRTITVVAEDAGSYYANFSPLDTEHVIKSLAKRGNFSLCDYNFSLKGSQKSLNSQQVYSDYAN
ncbi:hypothetical protein AADZ86_17070 [Colwelliaceae bacterium BS250]